jgi:diguanylate cyclase (GGDEF)-like protein/putative nucleotidyltransferase with HDIG domain
MASTLVRHVRTQAGEDAIDEILSRARLEYSAGYLDDPSNWIWQHEAIDLLVAAADVLGDPEIGLHVGEQTVRQHAGTPVATMLRSLGSPEAVYEQLTVAVSKFSTTTDLHPEVEEGRAVVSARSRHDFVRHPLMCDWTRGLLSQPPALFGAPPAHVEESLCQARGDECCRYTITWDAELATADPQQLATALETQIAAMTQRMDNMYATARDLIAVDDLDGALARITERAATAARAPNYLLAVRTNPADPPRVHHRGYVSDEEVAAAASALLEGSIDDADGSRIVVDVASATRHYGRLMAASPGGAFFAHEREALDVYARYAATVLDTATALEEARSREEQSRALLELSRAVAAASTSDEVARRLAEVVPAVVDCDRVATFIWDEEEEALVCRAMTGHGEMVRDLRIRATDTPVLATLLEHAQPSPIFFEPDTDDEFVAGILRQTGSKALIVVPIVAHDHFYGSLHVSVGERPERLQPTAALLDLLAGVVAQTATALDNARLIETMAHQARFDNLTGLLGHRAFHEALEIQLEVAKPFTLASIDIDDFKLINDLHGHPIGDEALRRVAEALRRGAGEHDSVFRVGGEEFAVLLPGRDADDARQTAERLREAVASTPFTLPLRVSIGLASWPGDAKDRDSLLERADDALYGAKRAGKNRVVGAGEDHESVPAKRDSARANLLDVLRTKDGDTLTHSARVAALAVDTGRILGLESARLAVLRVAGQLHDIGKLALPDAVLNKPGPLDDDEMQLVRTHPVLGAELVRAWGEPGAARFVLEHHERMDGKGYPAGLSGDEISLEGRILHAVDAFTAMTSDRPYRGASSVDEAVAELRAMSGTQFDADVARALEQVLAGGTPDWTVDTIVDSPAPRSST